jgi:hypothetical protein
MEELAKLRNATRAVENQTHKVIELLTKFPQVPKVPEVKNNLDLALDSLDRSNIWFISARQLFINHSFLD